MMLQHPWSGRTNPISDSSSSGLSGYPLTVLLVYFSVLSLIFVYVGVRLVRRCLATSSLRPPPSYTKLFLEDQPPAYNDSIVLKDGDNTCIEITEPSEDSEECDNSDNSDTVINIQDIIEERSASNHNEDNA